jgi:hypothetical protein
MWARGVRLILSRISRNSAMVSLAAMVMPAGCGAILGIRDIQPPDDGGLDALEAAGAARDATGGSNDARTPIKDAAVKDDNSDDTECSGAMVGCEGGATIESDAMSENDATIEGDASTESDATTDVVSPSVADSTDSTAFDDASD